MNQDEKGTCTWHNILCIDSRCCCVSVICFSNILSTTLRCVGVVTKYADYYIPKRIKCIESIHHVIISCRNIDTQQEFAHSIECILGIHRMHVNLYRKEAILQNPQLFTHSSE